MRHFIGLFSIKTADSANQEIAQWSPDPFSRERVASGHETEYMLYTFSKFTLCTSQTNMHYLLHNAYTSILCIHLVGIAIMIFIVQPDYLAIDPSHTVLLQGPYTFAPLGLQFLARTRVPRIFCPAKNFRYTVLYIIIHV